MGLCSSAERGRSQKDWAPPPVFTCWYVAEWSAAEWRLGQVQLQTHYANAVCVCSLLPCCGTQTLGVLTLDSWAWRRESECSLLLLLFCCLVDASKCGSNDPTSSLRYTLAVFTTVSLPSNRPLPMSTTQRVAACVCCFPFTTSRQKSHSAADSKHTHAHTSYSLHRFP